MTIAESLYFVYDGVRSSDMGILNVHVSSGMLDEPFLPEQEIKEVTVRGRDTPHFMHIQKKPHTLNLKFAFQDTFNESKIREVARWLGNQQYYKELFFSDNNERIFYAIYIGSPTLIHNCLKQGYVDIQMRCDSPYSYSPIVTDPAYEWDEVPVTFAENNFTTGDKHGLVADASNRLKLDPVKTKWSDYPIDTKWIDL